jgi:hypothetical protein
MVPAHRAQVGLNKLRKKVPDVVSGELSNIVKVALLIQLITSMVG